MPPCQDLGVHELRVIGDGLERDVLARLAQATHLDTLEDVLAWALAQRPACSLVDVIVQDEFTHDVIVRAHAPAYLCFDST
jgi:hypothetical protein